MKRLVALVVAPLLALCVALGVAELLFRLMFTVTDVPLFAAEPVLGYRRAPNQHGRYLAGTSINSRFDINAQGWNHAGDFRTQKDSGVIRVALIGDSQVEALEVNPGETMSAVAERVMTKPGRRVDWLPFGVSGYGTSQELDVFRRYALAYNPDVVLIFFVQNDPFDSSPYLSRLEPFMTKYSLRGESLNVTEPSEGWKPSSAGRWALKSAIVRYFFVQKRLASRFATMGSKERRGLEGFPLRAPRLAPDSAAQRETWLLVEKLIAAARDESAKAGAQFAVVFRGAPALIDSAIKSPPALPPISADPHCVGARLEAMGPDCLEPIVKRLGIPYLDLTTPLQQMVTRTKESHHFADDIHYRAPAHAVAGQALAQFTDSLLTIRPSSPSPSPRGPRSPAPAGNRPRR